MLCAAATALPAATAPPLADAAALIIPAANDPPVMPVAPKPTAGTPATTTAGVASPPTAAPAAPMATTAAAFGPSPAAAAGNVNTTRARGLEQASARSSIVHSRPHHQHVRHVPQPHGQWAPHYVPRGAIRRPEDDSVARGRPSQNPVSRLLLRRPQHRRVLARQLRRPAGCGSCDVAQRRDSAIPGPRLLDKRPLRGRGIGPSAPSVGDSARRHLQKIVQARTSASETRDANLNPESRAVIYESWAGIGTTRSTRLTCDNFSRSAQPPGSRAKEQCGRDRDQGTLRAAGALPAPCQRAACALPAQSEPPR